MIALDPEFVGTLAPESKLTTRAEMLREKNSGEGQGGKGKKEGEVPFARMSRMERLRVAGKMDLSEVVGSDDEGAGGDEGGDGHKEGERRKESKEEREKRKMRGKGKSLKRYLRKQRKNVVDPAAVRFFLFFFLGCFSLCVLLRFVFSFLLFPFIIPPFFFYPRLLWLLTRFSIHSSSPSEQSWRNKKRRRRRRASQQLPLPLGAPGNLLRKSRLWIGLSGRLDRSGDEIVLSRDGMIYSLLNISTEIIEQTKLIIYQLAPLGSSL